ncbi:MAG: hypothetical protein AAGC91_14055 [Pseudomonadota bacterium]
MINAVINQQGLMSVPGGLCVKKRQLLLGGNIATQEPEWYFIV